MRPCFHASQVVSDKANKNIHIQPQAFESNLGVIYFIVFAIPYKVHYRSSLIAILNDIDKDLPIALLVAIPSLPQDIQFKFTFTF